MKYLVTQILYEKNISPFKNLREFMNYSTSGGWSQHEIKFDWNSTYFIDYFIHACLII